MQLALIPTSVQQFSHNAKEKCFTGEISDLAGRNFQTFYDDACDEGIALINPQTGNLTYWTVMHELCNERECEVDGWVLHPTWRSVQNNPKLNGYTMTVFND